MEVIVSTVIATIAVLGLAHMFGMGRGQIERFALARTALAAAEQRMESLALLPPTHPELQPGQYDSTFVADGNTYGEMRWIVEWRPHTWTAGPVHLDTLKLVTVEVNWDQSFADTVRVTRYFEK
jgi:hypothetical protein